MYSYVRPGPFVPLTVGCLPVFVWRVKVKLRSYAHKSVCTVLRVVVGDPEIHAVRYLCIYMFVDAAGVLRTTWKHLLDSCCGRRPPGRNGRVSADDSCFGWVAGATPVFNWCLLRACCRACCSSYVFLRPGSLYRWVCSAFYLPFFVV